MRKSNLLISKGSVVFAKFEANTKDAYLNDRPLIVVSNPTNILNSVMVCTCGTRDKPGILASLWNYEKNIYVGGNELSNIYPYVILTIRIEAIKSCIGQLDHYVMQAVDKAIDYHLGRTDEIPPYLKSMQESIQYVGYNIISENYYTENEINSKELKDQSDKLLGWDSSKKPHDELVVNPKYGKIKPNKKKFKERKQHKREDRITKNMIRQEINQTNTEVKLNSLKFENVHNPEFNVNKSALDFWIKNETLFPLNKKYLNTPESLLTVIGPIAVSCILARNVPISNICKKYSLSVKEATLLRVNLTNYYINTMLNLKEENNNEYLNTMSSPKIIARILIKHFISKESLTTNEFLIEKAYTLDVNDGRKWKSVREHYKH